MIENLIKDGYAVEVVDNNGSKLLHEEHTSKIAIFLDDSINNEIFRFNSDYMSKYKEIRIFNKAKEQ